MGEVDFDRRGLMSRLMTIHHGDLSAYVAPCLPASKQDPLFFAHLVAWNHRNGRIRDGKVAFPVLALRGARKDLSEFSENALAHLARLGPRELLKAYDFSGALTKSGHPLPAQGGARLRALIRSYLRERESTNARWDRVALQHRATLKRLYVVSHTKPSERAQAVLFKREYPEGSVFQIVSKLSVMAPEEAAGHIMERLIPFEIICGSVPKIHEKRPVILALIETMTANQLVNFTKSLKAWGVFEDPALRASYEAALERAKKSDDHRINTFKASKAAEILGEDSAQAKKLLEVQKVQEKKLRGIEGDWLVIADRSGSMQQAIASARHVAAALVSQAKGNVYLVFCNTTPIWFDVTGDTFDEINKKTRGMTPDGSTSMGCGLDALIERKLEVQGIAVVSDGGENVSPRFHDIMKKYEHVFGYAPTSYLLHVPGDTNVMSRHNPNMETFELGANVDLYSLPNIIASMRTSRYSLVDEIMETPLVTLAEVFKNTNQTQEVSS